jgi:hypothetical protein
MIKAQKFHEKQSVSLNTRIKIQTYRVCLWFGGFGPRSGFNCLMRTVVLVMLITVLVVCVWLMFHWRDMLSCGSPSDLCLSQSALPRALIGVGIAGVLWSQCVAVLLKPFADTLNISHELTAHARQSAGTAALVVADLYAREGAEAQARLWRVHSVSPSPRK